MPKTRQKPASPTPAAPPARPGAPQQAAGSKINPRLQADRRWQRTKRFGWDGR